jgi:hypothetical protein
VPPGQVPQTPPQPSSPQAFPSQLFWQTHWPVASQALPEAQVPQVQPSKWPHCLPLQEPVQVEQTPSGLQVPLLGQVPQVPPQPSEPQDLPSQLFWQTHWPVGSQLLPEAQVPQTQPPKVPHDLPAQAVAQLSHWPVGEQVPLGHTPQDPPQPSSPQLLASHFFSQTHWPV